MQVTIFHLHNKTKQNFAHIENQLLKMQIIQLFDGRYNTKMVCVFHIFIFKMAWLNFDTMIKDSVETFLHLYA